MDGIKKEMTSNQIADYISNRLIAIIKEQLKQN